MKQFLLDAFSIFFPRCYFVHLISKLHRDAEADAFQPCRSTKIDAYLLHLPGFDDSDVSFEKKHPRTKMNLFLGGDKVGCCKCCQFAVNSNFIQKNIFGSSLESLSCRLMTYGFKHLPSRIVASGSMAEISTKPVPAPSAEGGTVTVPCTS